MGISPVLMIAITILLMIVIFALPAWLFLRQEAMRSDIATAVHKVELMTQDYTAILSEQTAMNNKVNEVSAQYKGAEIRAISTEETIRALGNKINSRDRVEKQKEAATNRKEPENVVDIIQQHGLPLFDQSAVPSPPLKRKFGVAS